MPEYKKICLLGFTPDAEHILKEVIVDHDPSYVIQWVPASHPLLDGVVINATFLESSQVRKFVTKVRANVVSAYSDEGNKFLCDKQNIIAINLKDPSDRELRVWLNQLLTTAERQPTTLLNNTAKKNKTPAVATNKDLVLKQLKEGIDVVLRGVYQKQNTWIKVASGLVYIDYARENVAGYELWSWENATDDEIPDSARQLKLDLWLFEALWQSTLDGEKYIDTNAFYQLNRWPQPLSKQGRTEVLRLAAHAQNHPVNVHQLQVKTHYPLEKISKFLFATSYAGQTTLVEGMRSYVADKKPHLPQTKEEQKKNEEKKSLLARFREKLGL